jgi:hypothetical protein
MTKNMVLGAPGGIPTTDEMVILVKEMLTMVTEWHSRSDGRSPLSHASSSTLTPNYGVVD